MRKEKDTDEEITEDLNYLEKCAQPEAQKTKQKSKHHKDKSRKSGRKRRKRHESDAKGDDAETHFEEIEHSLADLDQGATSELPATRNISGTDVQRKEQVEEAKTETGCLPLSDPSASSKSDPWAEQDQQSVPSASAALRPIPNFNTESLKEILRRVQEVKKSSDEKADDKPKESCTEIPGLGSPLPSGETPGRPLTPPWMRKKPKPKPQGMPPWLAKRGANPVTKSAETKEAPGKSRVLFIGKAKYAASRAPASATATVDHSSWTQPKSTAENQPNEAEQQTPQGSASFSPELPSTGTTNKDILEDYQSNTAPSHQLPNQLEQREAPVITTAAKPVPWLQNRVKPAVNKDAPFQATDPSESVNLDGSSEGTHASDTFSSVKEATSDWDGLVHIRNFVEPEISLEQGAQAAPIPPPMSEPIEKNETLEHSTIKNCNTSPGMNTSPGRGSEGGGRVFARRSSHMSEGASDVSPSHIWRSPASSTSSSVHQPANLVRDKELFMQKHKELKEATMRLGEEVRMNPTEESKKAFEEKKWETQLVALDVQLCNFSLHVQNEGNRYQVRF